MANILVVDDTRNIRKMVTLALKKAGHQVTGAENGRQGLELFEGGSSWDLTLIDQLMPELEGRETALEIRHRDPGARLIMMTAYATPELASEIITGGAVDFLRKPFSTDTLRGAVTKALGRPKYDAPLTVHRHEARTSRPFISLTVNGFDFWPVLLDDDPIPPGVEVARPFLVRDAGEATRVLMGVTSHVRLQIEAETGRAFPQNDWMWDKVCEMSLSRYLFDKAQLPPDVLPVFEITASQMFTIRQIAHMGPFTNY